MLDYDAIVKFAIADFCSSEELSTPVYRADIHNTRDAAEREDLPLIYIWNEDPAVGSFTLSVNGRIVGHCLEAIVPRSDPKFEECRDRIMQILANAARGAVVETCQKLNCLPSQVF